MKPWYRDLTMTGLIAVVVFLVCFVILALLMMERQNDERRAKGMVPTNCRQLTYYIKSGNVWVPITTETCDWVYPTGTPEAK